jgi:predicted DNA-binding transcriptional regulator AlpA
MLESTVEIIRVALKSDQTVTAPDRARLIATLRQPETPKLPPEYSTPRLIKRREVAAKLSCSLRNVDALAARGVLARHVFPGRQRSSGFLAADIDALIAGSAKQNGGGQ